MAIQYKVFFDDRTETCATASSLAIDLVEVSSVFIGKINSKTIDEIHVIHSESDTDDFTITGTSTSGAPKIRSVDFTGGGNPLALAGHFHWTESSTTLTMVFKAMPTNGHSAAWEFGRFTAPPTKLKVVIKRQPDAITGCP